MLSNKKLVLILNCVIILSMNTREPISEFTLNGCKIKVYSPMYAFGCREIKNVPDREIKIGMKKPLLFGKEERR